MATIRTHKLIERLLERPDWDTRVVQDLKRTAKEWVFSSEDDAKELFSYAYDYEYAGSVEREGDKYVVIVHPKWVR